jgi:hypothetical protein
VGGSSQRRRDLGAGCAAGMRLGDSLLKVWAVEADVKEAGGGLAAKPFSISRKRFVKMSYLPP